MKSYKLYNVFFSDEQSPMSFLAKDIAEAVHLGIEFLRENNRLATISKIKEAKLNA